MSERVKELRDFADFRHTDDAMSRVMFRAADEIELSEVIIDRLLKELDDALQNRHEMSDLRFHDEMAETENMIKDLQKSADERIAK